MANIATSFSSIVNNMDVDTGASGSYWGVLIHAYRRKRNLSLEQMAGLLKIKVDSLLRIECGFGSLEEFKSILSTISSENK